MSRTLSYEISDEMYAVFEKMARRSGVAAETFALRWLARSEERPAARLTETEHREAVTNLLRHAGAVTGEDPDAGDTEKIDRELEDLYSADVPPET